mgnify:CR=1 FL=1
MVDDIEFHLPPHERRLFCNRTLNMRTLRAIGFDMDYTLIHYRTEEWERRAYEHAQKRLVERGWPVEHLRFEPNLVSLGLIMDLELGNIVKGDRFGYVRKACHGTRMLSYEEQRQIYSRTIIDLGEPRWMFMHTLFALSEACMYAQTVELLDQGKLPEEAIGYADLYRIVRSSIDATHMEGALKAEIAAEPDRFVEVDPELPLALLDLKRAGKVLLLITNSEWQYTQAMMTYALNPGLPEGMTWRDLFDVVIVQAGKPNFFSSRSPFFEIVDEERGWLTPHIGPLQKGHCYLGGNAAIVERDLKLSGEEILYVGDHIFADVHMSKNLLRWRTALVLRDLEEEIRVIDDFRTRQNTLRLKMAVKEQLEHRFSLLRLALQRLESGYGPQPSQSAQALREQMQQLRAELVALDQGIAPIARDASELLSSRWGLLMRAGNDKSHLARQIERYADIYTSRVSNFLLHTPFIYLRAPRGSLPHDEAILEATVESLRT